MRRSSRRGQTEPIAALAAVFAVVVGLTLYVGVLDATLAGSPDRAVADRAIPAMEAAVAPSGVAEHGRLQAAIAAAPSGYHANVTLATPGDEWQAGPSPPPAADTASRPVAIRTAPATVRAGTLEVSVWR